MKILNLYAGIGGNRKYWNGDKHDIVAVENGAVHEKVLDIYRKHFPDDTLVQDDAHKFLKDNFRDFDFIWSSPPCPTHSSIRKSGSKSGQYEPVYPDMKLYEEIIFLEHYFEGKYVVENVQSYYNPLIEPVRRHRHYLWSNFDIPKIDVEREDLHNDGRNRKKQYGFDLTRYDMKNKIKGKILRNCVHPELGKHVLENAEKTISTKKLDSFT